MQGSQEWLDQRKGKLTASNVGAALGLCTWVSRQQAFDRALGNDSFVGNDATRHGQAHENDGIAAYMRDTGNHVQATGLHVHPQYDWLAGSPDGLVGEDGLIEVKCPYWRRKDGKILHDKVPPYYYLQMQLCLECTDRKWCDYICWTRDAHVIYRVLRDENLQAQLMPHYEQFVEAMQRGDAKPPVLKKADKDDIAQTVERSMQHFVQYEHWNRARADQCDFVPKRQKFLDDWDEERGCQTTAESPTQPRASSTPARSDCDTTASRSVPPILMSITVT